MEQNQRYALLADDFTGALDTGVQFLAAGARPILEVPREELAGELPEGRRDAPRHGSSAGAREPSLRIVDTESRFLDPGEAASVVAAATGRLLEAGYTRFFKKIDSTFRGNVGAEVDSILSLLRLPAAAICPAVPENGRTVENGIVYVRGVPLAESESGRDRFTPIGDSRVTDILRRQSSRQVAEICREILSRGVDRISAEIDAAVDRGAQLIIFDGGSGEELRSVAEALRRRSQPLLPVGASGLAAAMATVEAGATGAPASGGAPASADKTATPPGPMPTAAPAVAATGRVLIVAGSLMETTVAQAVRLVEEGNSVATLDVDIPAALAGPEQAIARLREQALKLLGGGDSLLVRTVTPGEAVARADKSRGMEAATFTGRLSAAILRRERFDTLVLTGGATALSVVQALGITSLRIIGESASGIPVSRGFSPVTGREYRIVTKAGGFGSPEVFLDLLTRRESAAD